MQMEKGLDTGPVLARRATPISPQDTAQSLTPRLAELGAALVCTTLDDLAAGPVAAVAQGEEGVTYAAKIGKAEALIDWAGDAEVIARKVRAFNPWPVAETRFQAKQLRIWEAVAVPGLTPIAPVGRVLGVSKAGLDVACGQGVLRILRLQSPGRTVQDAQHFANAAPLAGAKFSSA